MYIHIYINVSILYVVHIYLHIVLNICDQQHSGSEQNTNAPTFQDAINEIVLAIFPSGAK